MAADQHPAVLIAKAVPAACTLLFGYIARIDPKLINPWISVVVGCLAGVYYIKMIFFNKKK